tara:strand:- start:291 stop:1433 length:1143 start_codon:yes stop_codon:yes gene_type:complete
MKVLYIAHYREFGGWSQAAIDQMLALDSVGVDVVCRNITLTSDRNDIPSKILEFENKDSSNCDVCIQHVLPHHLVGSQNFQKNIAFLESESLSIRILSWFPQLEMMDEVWVANQTLLKSLQRDGLDSKVRLVHHATDIKKYERKHKSIIIPDIKDTFKFYYAGDLNDRKNLECISTCFHSEFDKSEDVSLVLKVNKFGHSPEAIHQRLDSILTKVKTELRIYPDLSDYKKEAVITNKLPEQDMHRLHDSCDCFLLPSRGEAWSIPALDAVGFGSTPICSNFGGPAEFIDDGDVFTGFCVDGVYSCCKCSDSAFPDMFTAREFWFTPCEQQIMQAMRGYYESWKSDPEKHARKARDAGLKAVQSFSYENVGQKMLEILNDV